jgi:hypothetical protein
LIKTRNELIREYYLKEIDKEKYKKEKPRDQTGPKASFMSWVGRVKKDDSTNK